MLNLLQSTAEDPSIERKIIRLLIYEDEQRPWTVSEVELVIGAYMPVEDALHRLHAAGLIDRYDELTGDDDVVWATRAAVAAAALVP